MPPCNRIRSSAHADPRRPCHHRGWASPVASSCIEWRGEGGREGMRWWQRLGFPPPITMRRQLEGVPIEIKIPKSNNPKAKRKISSYFYPPPIESHQTLPCPDPHQRTLSPLLLLEAQERKTLLFLVMQCFYGSSCVCVGGRRLKFCHSIECSTVSNNEIWPLGSNARRWIHPHPPSSFHPHSKDIDQQHPQAPPAARSIEVPAKTAVDWTLATMH
jgi:hypothetical protein